jgi:hypothetical protein
VKSEKWKVGAVREPPWNREVEGVEGGKNKGQAPGGCLINSHSSFKKNVFAGFFNDPL